MRQSFVHLHLHTEYSLVNGMIRLPALISQTLQNQMPAVAITDMGNLYGTVKFFNKCVAQGIKPIIGAEVYIENPDKVAQPYILVLLVQDKHGYRNLSELLSRGFREGQQQGMPIIEKAWLEGKTNGLIALSGGQRGELGGAISAGRQQLQESVLDTYQRLFPGRFYIEIQRIGRDYEDHYIAGAAKLAAKHSVPLVATNDAHFMQEREYDAHVSCLPISQAQLKTLF